MSDFAPLQVHLDTSTTPGAVTELAVEAMDCAILVKWTGPTKLGGYPVTEYKFELRTNGSEYTSAVLNCTLSQTTCYLPMTTMQAHPYYLTVGQEIAVRITTANQLGWGTPILHSAGYVQSVPSQMPQPLVKVLGAGAVRIEWPLLDGLATGNQPVLTYDLVWDGGDANSAVNIRVVDTASNFHVLRDLDINTRYRVAIRAHNQCGYGQFSEVAYVDIRAPPTKMGMVRTGKAQNCGAYFSWLPPSDGGSSLTHYSIEVKDYAGVFTRLPLCG